MKFIRPLAIADLQPGTFGPWLIAPEEGAGCAVRLRRGGAGTGDDTIEATLNKERFALILRGEAELQGGDTGAAQVGELIFIPAGTQGRITGSESSIWAEIEAPVIPSETQAQAGKIVPVDQSRFEGTGFAYQSLIDGDAGASSMRMNVLQVQPGSGSPDYHLHTFAQIYLIQEGEMTLDIGTARLHASADTLVYLPAGVVHRNFNASQAVERHVSLLVPEPRKGELFDYAVTIQDCEAELLTKVPA